MATVPRVEGVSVGPNAGGLGVSAPAGAFGGNVAAEVLHEASQTVNGMGDVLAKHALERAALDNKISADTAGYKFVEETQKLQERFVLNNQGVRATDAALGQAYTDLEKLRSDIGSTLNTPAARDIYNSQSRIGSSQAMSGLRSHVVSEQFKSRDNQIEANTANAVRAANADNMGLVHAAVGAQGYLKAQLHGFTEAESKAWIANKLGDAEWSVVTGLARETPAQAKSWMDKHGAEMSPAQRSDADAKITASAQNITVSAVADAAVVESTGAAAVGSRAARNNNPLNLTVKGTPWAGQTGTDGRFVKFSSPEAGFAAADANLRSYAGKGINTLTGIISRWAPPSENDTLSYINTVAKATGLAPNARLDMNDAAVRGKILRAMAVVEGGGHSGGAAADPYDSLLASVPQKMEEIANNPLLHHDPKLVGAAQQQYQNKVNDQIWAHNTAAKAATDFIVAASQQTGITDPALLQQQPGVLEAMSKLSDVQQRTLRASLTAEGNRWTPEKQQHFDGIMGLQVTNPQAFLNFDGTREPGLTNGQRASISSTQLGIKKKGAMDNFKQVSINRALQNPLVATATSKLKPDAYNIFTGAMMGELEQWAEGHPGKKPSDAEIASMANNLLAQRTARSVSGGTFQRPTFEVPEPIAREIVKAFTDAGRTPPSPALVAEIYQREH